MDVYGTICRFHRCLIGAMLRSPPPSCSCGAVLPLHASICPSVSSCFLCIHSQPPARNLSTMFKFHRWVMSRMRYIYIYIYTLQATTFGDLTSLTFCLADLGSRTSDPRSHKRHVRTCLHFIAATQRQHKGIPRKAVGCVCVHLSFLTIDY